MRIDVEDRDNPETIRLKKYASGAHLLLEIDPVETGTTTREVVWTKNKAKLYRYEPEKPKKYPVPILIVYALINRPYVLDYQPRMVSKVLRASGSEEVSLFGYCQGGTIAAMYAALFPEGPLRNLVLLASPVRFTPENGGIFKPFFDPDPVIEAFGNVPATELLGTGRRLPGTADRPENETSRLPREAFTDSFLAASAWVDDGVPFPGEAFRSWVFDFYRHDRLARGELKLRGLRVDLSKVRAPLLNVAGREDLVCTFPQAEAAMDLVGSEDKELLPLDAGHVGLMAGPVAKREFWPHLARWLGRRSA
ncbi:MAG TPA: alpha/beta fold hydrolase [Rubrobacteraceae bacterium]|nr:alpha/beta fold hydrolase [Rubrobacteraceae bacterium]